MNAIVCGLLLALAGSSAADLFPNPKKGYTLCSRPAPSRICDPDVVFSRDGADIIEMVAVAIKKGLTWPLNHDQDGSQLIADLMFKEWNLGGVCKAGLLVMVDASTGQTKIWRSPLAKESLSDDSCADIVYRAQGFLNKKKFDKAIKQIVLEVGLSMAGHHPRDPLYLRKFMRMGFGGKLLVVAGLSMVFRLFSCCVCVAHEVHTMELHRQAGFELVPQDEKKEDPEKNEQEEEKQKKEESEKKPEKQETEKMEKPGK